MTQTVFNCGYKEDCAYYKQLKRLQHDYVNLSKSFEHLKTSYQENQDYISQLKDENTELKTENEWLREEINKIRENKCTDCIQHLITKSHKLALKKADKIFKALQEIKDYLNTLSGIDNDFVNTETYLRILDCITKAEEE